MQIDDTEFFGLYRFSRSFIIEHTSIVHTHTRNNSFETKKV